eukprot:CAMPEP_0172305190 /NCGR_PEP_ID=MMETSP1058-20130122/6527_1 /TAXON_ID=83371 /ORGANISM="Detonula confervacea, Strain CCMP 353" /LENGTH=427 /DNA_ID=CAMNT_0013016713 /DNA_START=20 /DNA_END=1303 /DNA_ORIENTATION=+
MNATRPMDKHGGIVLGPKPKRPLSAFNLFYRFKRQKVLDAISHSKANDDDITRLVDAAPGLEHCTPDEDASSHMVNDLRRKNIRNDLEGKLLPRDTRDRAHRTNQGAMNGAMSFLELGKLMNSSWKSCDDFAKSVFHELAEEGRELYRRRLKEYNDRAISMGLAGCPEPKATTTKKKLPTKKNSDGKASPGVEVRDDDSVNNGKAGAKRGHLPGNMSQVDKTSSPRNAREAAPSLLDRQSKNDIPNSAENMLMRLANTDSLRSVISTDYSASQESQPHHGHVNDAEVSLRARVKELEGQLAAERLRARVRELEGDLARQKSVEEQLRAQVGALTRSHGIGSAAAVANPPPMPGDGLWSLVSASMIHPSVRAQERNAMLSRMVAARNGPTMQRALPFPPVHLPSEGGINGRQRDHTHDDSPNKKQRLS